jgi:lipoprotein-anchoring transpeptidase ErfK/SrfK
MSRTISRREFLKLGGVAALGLAFRDFPPGGDPTIDTTPPFTLGRTVYSMRYYDRPSFSGIELGYYITDTVVNIFEQRIGDPKPTHNPIWLRTDDGWLHSSYVQPVESHLNEPVLDIPYRGMLFEVTVPYSQVWDNSEFDWKRAYRIYYGTTYWVNFAFKGANGEIWYQLFDDLNKQYYVTPAKNLRPVAPEELTAISPGTLDKRIVVDLTRQRLNAYEGSKPVFTSRIATGYFEGDTPLGEFRVERKQPSRHMASNLEGNEFDLPGVPWVCYIAWTGVSVHGTYWHNNYGTPQSHGCINLNPKAAKWIYRWTEPYVPFDEDYVETENGTRVTVVE